MARNGVDRGAHTKRGLTLIETLVVVSILTMLAGASLFFDVNNFRGTAFNSEMANLATALQTARANALNNVNQSEHGVAINPTGYVGFVIFEGSSYATRDTARDSKIPSMYTIAVEPSSPTEVVFTQLSGIASPAGDLTLRDPQRDMTRTIGINYEGRIDW